MAVLCTRRVDARIQGWPPSAPKGPRIHGDRNGPRRSKDRREGFCPGSAGAPSWCRLSPWKRCSKGQWRRIGPSRPSNDSPFRVCIWPRRGGAPSCSVARLAGWAKTTRGWSPRPNPLEPISWRPIERRSIASALRTFAFAQAPAQLAVDSPPPRRYGGLSCHARVARSDSSRPRGCSARPRRWRSCQPCSGSGRWKPASPNARARMGPMRSVRCITSPRRMRRSVRCKG